MRKMLIMGCVVTAELLCLAQYVDVTVNMPARYELHEGIKVAIRNVEDAGRTLSVATVLKELERMEDANDVSLPYEYTVVSTIGKDERGILKGKNKKKKAEVEQIVANMIKKEKGIVDAEIKPAQYKTEQEFVDAFVADRMNHIDDETKGKYGKKLGGLNEYKRECRREAKKIWAKEKTVMKK